MRILKVIHGYPMRYNAGSEVYSQTLCHGLAKHHQVHVFTREEDAFAPDFRLRTEPDADDPRITLHLVNNPRLKDRYRASGIDQQFAHVLDRVEPDIVHVGHLNHLSTSLLREVVRREIPIVFTLHDYWLMCPRGQFMQMFPEDPNNLWAACDGQDDRKCAERCYARYFSGAMDDFDADLDYWRGWVARRMRHVREMTDLVDLFIAPARYLRDRFRNDFGLPERKLVYLDYGFARERMAGRRRVPGEPFTFGYIGTHIPAKGVQDLIRAFGLLGGGARLRIWGRPRGQDTEALRRIAASLPESVASRIEWFSEYRNQEIVRDVFDRCDAIVVPSVWVENSPLVIHEAQQARVPVVTADAGGMAEYVHHEVNGLLFRHRSVSALAEQMQRLVDSPDFASRLGSRGYVYSDTGDIPSIEQHVSEIERLYDQVLNRQASTCVCRRPGPWRITFDTNPDTCNLSCIMCEEHSPHSPLQHRRKEESRSRRLMPFELIERVIAETVPHGLQEIIPSTMGEPLLYEHFEDMIELCHRYNVKLNLTTNGTFPRLGAAAWAERIVPVTTDVKISWNGASPATQEAIMLGSRWEKMLDHVRDFISVRDAHAAAGGNRCRVTFQLTFLESNVDELADMIRLAVRLGVDRVKGHHLWTHFREIQGQSMRRNPSAIERWNRAVVAARQAAAEQPLANGQHIRLENIVLLDTNEDAHPAPRGACPFLGQEAWVSATGRFAPCCAPDVQRRALGDFGSLDERGFMEIWNGEAYQELTAIYRNYPLCLGCHMRKPVGGVDA
ncbi:radical SAM protein [Ectothiorhodospira shaposhnikovii]|uniref:glycosyltransferase n=1 Tax=Ectothiorhodospira shaposhnikovii TaxID=1054 RepID=UPI00190428DE|nr:glycosyltransferase [Ectothiorhodospira shaposhnikovii]MBK1672991.1 radical SAM protein [Ectothiorhodospira shaposhnikovii]